MAPRKKPQTEPVLDNSEDLRDLNNVIHEMNDVQFSGIIKQSLTVDKDAAQGLLNVTTERLKELGVEKDTTKAITDVPEYGSDQFDPGSFIDWVNKISPIDDNSIEQLLKIDATLRIRLNIES